MIRSAKITRAARGQDCTLNIVGVCNYNAETTVLAHLPDCTHGMGHKSSDIASCFACSACHDMIDNRVKPTDGFEADKDWYLRRAQTRTMEKLFELGVLKVA